jgi:hypothetical protein
MTTPRLWHTPDIALSVGDVIPAGSFGQASIAGGGAGDWYFFRECLIEHIRVSRVPGAVSRLSCAFAFESHQIATACAAAANQPCYEVVPVDPIAPISRHDMAWIEWIGRPGTQPGNVVAAIERYWTRCPIEAGDEPSQWEWLSSSGLRVTGNA